MARKDEQGLEALGMWSALTAALAAIRTPALLIDPTGTVVHANPAASALLTRQGLPPFGALVSGDGDRRASGWRLTTLGDPPDRFGFIAVLDPDRGAWRQRLTARQTKVLDLVAQGLTNATIAENLEIEERTVEVHLSAIFDKAGVESRTALLAKLLSFTGR
ncbi:MAG TPA: LuxR C-terminal-related transcriptional regulator [Polyangia bacterium]|nr:LuxR C-terminal-related transcriptional regulator [Polyangia bacterium]